MDSHHQGSQAVGSAVTTIVVTADGYEIFTLRSDDTIARTSP
jgi:uncharacterized protein GlcG (DUF336 family)